MRRGCYFTQEIPAEEKKKINLGTIKRLIRYAIPYKKTFTLIFCLVVFTSVISLLPNLLLRYIINTVIPAGNEDMGKFYLTVGGFLLLGLLQVVVPRIYGLLLQTRANAIISDIRDEFFDKLQTLSFDFFDSRPIGKVSICVTSYVDEIATFFSGYLISFIVNLLQIVIVTVCMVAISPILSLVIYSAIIPLTICYVFLRKYVRKHFRKQRFLDANRNAFTLESISGERIIKSFNPVEEDSDIYTNDIQKECITNWYHNLSRHALFGPIFQLFWNYGTLMIYFVGLLCIQRGAVGMDAGTIILFINYLGFCSGPFLSISNMLSTLASVTTNMEKIFEVLDTESTVADRPDAKELPTVKGAIEFEHVDFEYKKNHLILKDINLKVAPGEMIALVGPTGAGKTTFINLLTRFYDVKNGVVRIDGADIRDVTLHSLRSEIGVIMQDPFLFKGTLMENIRYGKLDATDEEVFEAAKIAKLRNKTKKIISNCLPLGHSNGLGDFYLAVDFVLGGGIIM